VGVRNLRVVEAKRMTPRITAAATGLVYRNPQPSLRSIVAYHPSLVLLSENEFLATFDLGEAVESLDYHAVVARSKNGGQTWQLEGAVLQDPPPLSSHTIRTSRLADGSLVGFGALFHRKNPELGLLNPQTSGFVPTDLFLVRSKDGGRSWTAPQTIVPPLPGPCWELCHPVVELRDYRWIAPVGTWRGWQGEIPSGEQTLALLSDDQGKSWSKFGRIFDGRKSGRSHLEVSAVELDDGRILAVSWVHDLTKNKNFPSEYSLSESRGENFSEPMLTGFRAQTCKLIQLRNGLLLGAFRDTERPGLWATVARLEGKQWITLSEAPLWQGAVTGMQGRRSSAEELSALQFGYPSMKQLSNGEVLLLFWCQENCITSIRWIRIQIE
jgi:sialidase-1